MTRSMLISNIDDHEVLQIQMINEDLDQNISTFQFEASVLQASNNSQKLFVVDLVVTFCRNHVLAIEDH